MWDEALGIFKKTVFIKSRFEIPPLEGDKGGG